MPPTVQISSALWTVGAGDGPLRAPPGVRRLSRDTYLPRALADDVVSRVAADLLAAPPGAVVGHRTAADLWQLELPLHPPDREVARGRHRPRGLPVTTAARTWRDLADALARRPGGRGAERARDVLPLENPLAGSPMESVRPRRPPAGRVVLTDRTVLRYTSADTLGCPDAVIGEISTVPRR